MAKVVVLLSTWNGMQFLSEQIASLLNQKFVGDLAILVRDDGSTDGTTKYLKNLDPRITLVEGDNLGPKGSFFELLRLAKHENADFYALCDQDDVWHAQKIQRALSFMQRDRSSIYASSLALVDEALNPISNYTHPGDRSFPATLVTNFVTGCTCAFNRAFLEQLPFPTEPNKVIMHDWWLASVATIGSEIHYDPTSFIAYRQHSSNHVGIKRGMAAMLGKVRKAIENKPAVTRFDHARQLLLAAGDRLADDQLDSIRGFLATEHSLLRRAAFSARHLSKTGLTSALRFAVFR